MRGRVLGAALLALGAPALARAQGPGDAVADVVVTCASKTGERQYCAADTSHGIALVESTGEASCLLGKTWGYDDKGVWVSDGCSGRFVVGRAQSEKVAERPEAEKKKFLEHIPNLGFRLYEGDKGQIYFRLFSYLRYLNQRDLDPTYVDSFGNTKAVQIREDFQLTKVFMPFSGWFLTPKFRYYLYVWTSNVAAGDGGQIYAAGNLSWVFNEHLTIGGGWGALPNVRSTENQFPYWLGVDDRVISDEFFRGSYTTGVWARGDIVPGLKYAAMVGNNLSQLGVSASQLAAGMHTQALNLQWYPTTKEFGYLGTFGDYEDHQQVATRLGGHWSHSREDKQSQPSTNGIENTQIRLTDGNIVFTPDLFGPGISVDRVTYEMVSLDAGVKYRGFAIEAEYYWRTLSNFTGPNTEGIEEIDDHGYQIQTSAMVVPKTVQVYLSGGEIRGRYGNGSEIRAGANWYIRRQRGLRINAEWNHLDNCPVGYTAVPYPVGGNGNVYHATFEMNF